MTEEKLAKCPLCGTNPYRAPQSTFGGLRGMCKNPDCQFQSKGCKTSELAAEAWNQLCADIALGRAAREAAAKVGMEIKPSASCGFMGSDNGYGTCPHVRIYLHLIPQPPASKAERGSLADIALRLMNISEDLKRKVDTQDTTVADTQAGLFDAVEQYARIMVESSHAYESEGDYFTDPTMQPLYAAYNKYLDAADPEGEEAEVK